MMAGKAGLVNTEGSPRAHAPLARRTLRKPSGALGGGPCTLQPPVPGFALTLAIPADRESPSCGVRGRALSMLVDAATACSTQPGVGHRAEPGGRSGMTK